jgi:hypothetical protein
MAIKDILKTHRTWEDGAGLVLGLMIGLSPWFYDEPAVPAVLLNSGLTGLAVLALAQLELVRVRRWEEIAQLACGLWLFASPSSLSTSIKTISASGIGRSVPPSRSSHCWNFGKTGIVLAIADSSSSQVRNAHFR